MALVSDAGMPVISDPGYRIVRLARERGIEVEPIPGPVAAIIALAASGIPPLPFTFLGFSPHRKTERVEFLRRAAEIGHTVVFYESPERVVASLEDAAEIFGAAEVAVARELTKMHEEIFSGTVPDLLENFRGRDSVKGEFTIVLGAMKKELKQVDPADIAVEFKRMRDSGMKRNDAVKAVAEKFGLRKNEVYKLLIRDAE